MSNVRSLERARNGMPTLSTHVGTALHATHVIRRSVSKPAVQGQLVKGAPRRRAAPGSQSVKVAAGAATSGRRRSARTTQPSLQPGKQPRRSLSQSTHRFPRREMAAFPGPAPKRSAYASSHATTGVGAGAHARHASVMHCPACTRRASFASEQNAHMRGKYGAFLRQAPNPSIERTFQRPLRALWPAAHVKR